MAFLVQVFARLAPMAEASQSVRKTGSQVPIDLFVERVCDIEAIVESDRD